MGDRLKGRIALVTGGASGIGRASALRFAAEGAKVVVNDINAAGVEEVVAAIKKAGGDAVPAIADVSNSKAVNSIVDDLVTRWGRFDVLLNCAFLMTIGQIGDLTDEQWRSTIR